MLSVNINVTSIDCFYSISFHYAWSSFLFTDLCQSLHIVLL